MRHLLSAAIILCGVSAISAEASSYCEQVFATNLNQAVSTKTLVERFNGAHPKKSEFETQADYQSRIEKSAESLKGLYLIQMPISGIKYDSEAQVFDIEYHNLGDIVDISSMFSGIGSRSRADFPDTEYRDGEVYHHSLVSETNNFAADEEARLNPKEYKDIDEWSKRPFFMLSETVLTNKESYVGENAYGASREIKQLDIDYYGFLFGTANSLRPFLRRNDLRYKRGEFEGIMSGTGADVLPRPLFRVAMSPVEAEAMKETLWGFVVVSPKYPFYVSDIGKGTRPTIKRPIDIDAKLHFVAAELDCLGVSDGSNRIYGIFDVRMDADLQQSEEEN